MELIDRLDDEHRAVVESFPPNLFGIDDIPQVRRAFEALINIKPPELPETVEIDDRFVDGYEGHQLMIRTYERSDRTSTTGALYWIHGGGMILGDVSMSDFSCSRLADQLGVLVASVEYRLAPEYPYPVPLEDCCAGLAWLFDQAGELDIDPARVVLGGQSAGGGLAAGLALLARDRGLPSPCLQLLTYPMLDDRNDTPSSHAVFDPRVWNRAANEVGWTAYLAGQAGADDVSPYAAPARATDLAGLPPAYITVGELDMFIDEDIAYAQALHRAGVPTELHVYAGAFHGSDGFVPKADASLRWRRDELAALERAFGA